MDAPLQVILDMIMMVFSNTIGTMGSLIGMLGNLSESLAFIGGLGTLGFVVAALVLVGVLYFLGKFFLNSWKLIAMLFVAGMIILWMLISA